jgi:hypothetical protein
MVDGRPRPTQPFDETTRCSREKCGCRRFVFDASTPAICLNCVHSCEWHQVPAKVLF